MRAVVWGAQPRAAPHQLGNALIIPARKSPHEHPMRSREWLLTTVHLLAVQWAHRLVGPAGPRLWAEHRPDSPSPSRHPYPRPFGGLGSHLENRHLTGLHRIQPQLPRAPLPNAELRALVQQSRLTLTALWRRPLNFLMLFHYPSTPHQNAGQRRMAE